MTGDDTAPKPPEADEIVAAIRTGLARLLAPQDRSQVDLDSVGPETMMLSLPVDSAVLMALMTELEDTFTVFIEEEAAFAFTSVGDVVDYIRGRIAERARRASDA